MSLPKSLAPDVIVANASPSVAVLQLATKTTPIVFLLVAQGSAAAAAHLDLFQREPELTFPSSRRCFSRRTAAKRRRFVMSHDTRALQAWLGHKSIQHTVRYTELAPERFKDFWR